MEPLIRTLAADDGPGIETYVRIRSAVTPDDADSPANAAWEDATYPGQVFRLLATVDGEPVAAATTGRLHVYPPDHPGYYLGCWVLPGWRRQGIGTALADAAAGIARAEGKSEFRTWIDEDKAEGVAFLRARGFEVVGRDKSVALALAGLEAPDATAPPGFALTTLAVRPDLAADVWRVAVESFPSIPSLPPIEPGPLEEFVARDIARASIPAEAFALALDASTGEVAGYASIRLSAGEPGVASHDMTAVRPAYRGRGVATALKRATIAWAIGAGLHELRTGNDEANAPMRAVNAALGYRPLADHLALRGPLLPGDAASGTP